MKISDIKRLFSGLNRDDSPAFLKDGEYVDGLNIRTVSSEDEQESGVAETLRGEVEIPITAIADLTYYGEAIGGNFNYTGYEEVTIGLQTWMKKNWDANYPGSKVYDDLEANREIYGGLYTWNQIMSSDFAPDGWRVPTEADVDALLTYLGGALIAGGKMKEPATDHWLTPNTGADDSSGFKGLGGGKYDSAFDLLQEIGLFWLSDEEPELKDIDGNEYATIIIGTQEWIIENLRVTHYADGAVIPNLTVNADWTAEDGTPGHDGAYAWYNNDEANYKNTYGALYNYYAISNAHGLAYFTKGGVPSAGWRIPTLADYDTLRTYLGGEPVAGGKMKEAGLSHWDTPNTGADNSSGFTAVGHGQRSFTGVFSTLKEFGILWVNQLSDPTHAVIILLGNALESAVDAPYAFRFGFGIRCMRDL